ncbi:MAG TPA: hypothetical protein VFN22_08045 [Gemmatimonadales bacterium]|nr:hypothetical protein [Gemmatimonadales bacterium]
MSKQPSPNRSESPIPDLLDDATRRPTREEIIEARGGSIEPDTLLGRADGTSEPLGTLFANPGIDHLRDGFAGSGDEERPGDPSRSQNDGDLPEEHTREH